MGATISVEFVNVTPGGIEHHKTLSPDNPKILHVSFATERTNKGDVTTPILLTQVTDIVNSKIDGYRMQKMLPIGIIDLSWWSKWQAQLMSSHGVIIIANLTYWMKLEYGSVRFQETGEYGVETGIKQEADRIIQQRTMYPSFRVFVVDGITVNADGLRSLLTDGGMEINYESWKKRVQEIPSKG